MRLVDVGGYYRPGLWSSGGRWRRRWRHVQQMRPALLGLVCARGEPSCDVRRVASGTSAECCGSGGGTWCRGGMSGRSGTGDVASFSGSVRGIYCAAAPSYTSESPTDATELPGRWRMGLLVAARHRLAKGLLARTSIKGAVVRWRQAAAYQSEKRRAHLLSVARARRR